MTLVFILLLASGIRFLSAGPVRGNTDRGHGTGRTAGSRPSATSCSGSPGSSLLLGIYLILPVSG